MLIGEDGKKIGDVTMEFAEAEAEKAGKNLMMVAKNIYRIADTGKLKYEQKQKERKQRAQKRTHKIKEIKLGLLTDSHDLDIKARHIKEFLKKGLKTKVTMRFKSRQIAFKDAGLEKMRNFVLPIVESGLAEMDREPQFEGRSLVIFLTPAKK